MTAAEQRRIEGRGRRIAAHARLLRRAADQAPVLDQHGDERDGHAVRVRVEAVPHAREALLLVSKPLGHVVLRGAFPASEQALGKGTGAVRCALLILSGPRSEAMPRKYSK